MLSGQISVQGKSLACRFQFSCTQVCMCIETLCSAPKYLRVTFPARFLSIHNLLAFFSCDSTRHCWLLKVTCEIPWPICSKGKHQFPYYNAKPRSKAAQCRVNVSITGLAPLTSHRHIINKSHWFLHFIHKAEHFCDPCSKSEVTNEQTTFSLTQNRALV